MSDETPASTVVTATIVAKPDEIRGPLGTVLQFLQEDSGVMSMMRLLLFLTVINTLLLMDYATLRAPAGTIPDLPWGIVAFTASVITGKLVQKPFEKNC